MENFRRCLVAWIIDSNNPFDLIERPSFQRLIACATGSTDYIFSRATVRRDLEKMHSIAFNWIKNMITVIVINF
jgi:hypothetical protein